MVSATCKCIVAEELSSEGFDVYFPLHDVGVDLLVFKGKEHARIQVKASRYYIGHKWKSGSLAHDLYRDKLLRSVIERL
ncbi:MAG: hypothetical protein OEX01_00050 [Candidatus Bathyarchaeota archaeon]|nr:hypothetical protein [Candidatus Bathyarchaeota archaeon]